MASAETEQVTPGRLTLGRTCLSLLFVVWLLDNFGTTGPACPELAVLTDYHDGIRAGRHVQGWSLLHPRCSQQFNLASSCRIGGFIGSTNSAIRRAAIGGGPVARAGTTPIGDRLSLTRV